MVKQENAKTHIQNDLRRRFLGACLASAMVPIAVGLSGCSGSFNNNLVNGDTGTFYGAEQPTGNGNSRTFVRLKNGIPLSLGMEFDAAALNGLPTTPDSTLVVPFIGPLPSKTHGTPFTNVFLAYLTSHPATNEPPHFHLAILIRPALATAEPFPHERAPVAANEIPTDYQRATNAANPNGIVVPGGGVIYDDPTEPVGQPAATSLGQNYLFLDGHMNGEVIGPTIAQMKSKRTIVERIKQPKLYPRDGFYPTTWTVSYDPVRNTHLLALTDFKRADRVVAPGT